MSSRHHNTCPTFFNGKSAMICDAFRTSESSAISGSSSTMRSNFVPCSFVCQYAAIYMACFVCVHLCCEFFTCNRDSSSTFNISRWYSRALSTSCKHGSWAIAEVSLTAKPTVFTVKPKLPLVVINDQGPLLWPHEGACEHYLQWHITWGACCLTLKKTHRYKCIEAELQQCDALTSHLIILHMVTCVCVSVSVSLMMCLISRFLQLVVS